MKNIISAFLFSMLLLVPVNAQEKLVHGMIRDKITGHPIDLSNVEVIVMGFNTIAEAEDVVKIMKEDKNAYINIQASQAYPDQTGYYEIKVASTGALVVKADMVDPVLEAVDGRSEINVMLEIGNVLDAAVIVEERDEVAVIDPQSEIVGNVLSVSSGVTLPKHTGKRTARLIIQPVLIDRVSKDTLRFLRPLVVDGVDYAMTQNRRLNFDMRNDPLRRYVSRADSLTDEKKVIPWSANIYVKDPNKEYVVLGMIQLEDYNKPYMYKEDYLASVRIRRPLRYLKCDLPPVSIDMNDYYVPPRREKLSTGGSVSLNFLPNKARISEDDTYSMQQLDSLKQAMMEIVNGEDTFLKEFHIVGAASPEGSLARNRELSQKRTDYALGEILSVLPKSTRDRVWSTSKSVIHTWEDVASAMEADGDSSRIQMAGVIREIVEKYSDSRDRQSKAVASLPFYGVIRDEYLPRFRTVEYQMNYEVNRALTPEEILQRWQTDENYRSGRKSFTLHEFWQLFQMVKDEDELEDLYRRAYEESKRTNGTPWVLAAEKLAETLIKKEVTDTSLLSPFIDLKFTKTDIKVTRNNITTIINPKAVVCNQLVMYLRSGNFPKASQLAQILGSSEDVMLIKSYAMCMGGYYYGGSTPEKHREYNSYFETVCASSAWDRVVLCLARGAKEKVYNREAEAAIAALPDDEPMKYYFKAIVIGRKGYEYLLESEGNLYKACTMDPTLIEVAAGDGDLREDSVKVVSEALKDRETGDLIYGYY